MSPALTNLLGEIGKWAFLGLALVLSVAYFDDMKRTALLVIGGPEAVEMAESRKAVRKHNLQAMAARRDGPVYPKVAGSTVTLDARRDGHFYAPVRLNGREIRAVVDTGATNVALSYEDARSAGIYVGENDFTLRSYTANGIARAAPVMIERVELDGITVRNVQATVAEPGRLHITLLGMSFLGKLSRFEMQGRKLVLHN